MILRYLQVENFLGHELEEISFPEEGIFLLSGESGWGKSSLIVDAPAYALFGHVATRAKKQADLRYSDHPGQKMQVKAMFALEDDQQLIISRGLDEKDSSFARVYQPDPDDPTQAILLAEGAQPVARLLKKSIGGMSWQQFYAAFVARQSEIAMLTSLRGRERKDLVHRMLGMRELEKSAELISSGRQRTKAEVDQYERAIGATDLNEKRMQLSEQIGQLEQTERRIVQATQSKDDLSVSLQQITQKIEPLLKAADSARNKKLLQHQLHSAEQALQRHTEAVKLVSDAEQLQQKQSEAQTERERLLQLFTAIDSLKKQEDELNKLKEQEKELRSQLDPQLDEELEQIMQTQQTLKAEQAQRTGRLQELEQQLERLRDTGECFACLRPFDDQKEHHHVVENLENEIDKMKKEIEQSEQKLSSYQQAAPLIKQLQELDKQIFAKHQRVQELDQQSDGEQLQEVIEQGKQAAEQLKEFDQRLALVSQAQKDLDDEAEQRVQQLKSELEQIEEQQFEQDVLDQLLQEQKDYEQQLATVNGSLPELERSAKNLTQQIEQLKKELEGLEHEMESLAKLQERALSYERLQTLLREYQRQLAADIRPALEEIGSEMLQRISSGRLMQLRISDDYEIEVVTAKGFTLPALMLSGGESIRANICLRLALTRLVSQRTGVPVSFLILDEPLPSQDPGHVERIMELLESLRAFYPQQFIISHVGNLSTSDHVDHILEFTEPPGKNRLQLVSA